MGILMKAPTAVRAAKREIKVRSEIFVFIEHFTELHHLIRSSDACQTHQRLINEETDEACRSGEKLPFLVERSINRVLRLLSGKRV